MIEHTDTQKKQPAESLENDNTALSAALSVHYIVLVLYALGTFGGAASLLISIVSNAGIGVGQAAILAIAPILFSLHLLAVKGLRGMKLWGYNTSKLLAYLLLLAFPFGTVLGAILLSQLSKFRFTNQGSH
jgi:hypothetical protein